MNKGETFSYDLGHILKSAREDRDLSQKRVMELTGINNKTLSGYENNVAEPDFNTLITLFRLYGLSFDEMLNFNQSELKNDNNIIHMISALPKEQREFLYVQIRALYKKYCK